MKIIYKSRGTGKTTELVKLSASTQIPIICINSKYVIEVAKELGLTIPQPISIKDYKPFSNEKILVDDAEHVLAHLIGKIECATLSKDYQYHTWVTSFIY